MTCLLAIETATDHTSVALAVNGELLLREHGEAQRHTEQVAPAVAELLAEAGLGVHDLDVVAADLGPGLFTGLRVGLATATTLAAVLELPMATARSTDLLAEALAEAGKLGQVAVGLDARRGEVFAATYALDGHATLTGELRCLQPADFAELAATCDLVAGDGAWRYVEQLAGREVVEEPRRPSAATLARIGLAKHAAGELVAAHEVQALYLREPDAVANFSVRGRP